MSATSNVRTLIEVPSGGSALLRAALTSWGRAGAAGALPDTTLEVDGVEQDLARYARYAQVCGLRLQDRVSPTWLHVQTFPLQVALMSDRAFPFAVAGMVHVQNRMTQKRPVQIGDRLDLAVRAERLAPHRSGATVDLVGVARVDGETAWEGRSRYLVRGVRLEGAGDADAIDGGDIAPPDKDALPSPSADWRVPADIGRRYAAVSGDVNPIHLNPLTAKAFGFPRTIAHGMWTHARALGAVERDLPDSYRVDAAFTAPVLVPTTVSFGTAVEGAERVLGVASRRSGKAQFVARVTGIGG